MQGLSLYHLAASCIRLGKSSSFALLVARAWVLWCYRLLESEVPSSPVCGPLLIKHHRGMGGGCLLG